MDHACRVSIDDRLGRSQDIEKRRSALVQAYKDPELIEQSRQHALKQWSTHNANITVTHLETGESATIQGSVREFCLSRNLSYKAFNQLVNGKIKTSGGWYLGTSNSPPEFVDRKGEKRAPLSSEHRAKIAGGKFTGGTLVNDQGEVLVVDTNVKEQCRVLGISYTTLLKVLNKICRTVNGWRLSTV